MAKNGRTVSRRAFLGVSSAGLAAGLAPRALAGGPHALAQGEVLTTDVAVVGAGLSGLVAAHHLVRRGLSTLVLDASESIAGTANPAGAMGSHVRLLDLARRRGLRARRVSDGGQRIEVAGERVFEFPAGSYSSDSRLDTEVRRALARLDWMARETNPAAPWSTAHASVRDGRTLQQWIEGKVPSDVARDRLATLFQVVWGAHPSSLSLLHALAVASASGGMTAVVEAATAPTYAIPGGIDELRSRLASSLGSAVRTGTVARSIAEGGGGVVVATDTVEVRARRGVVVAVPLAATRAIDFGASLPRSRALLAQGASQGGSGPVICSATTAVWRRRGRSGHVVADGPQGGIAYPLGATSGGRQGLAVHLNGPGSVREAVEHWLGARTAAEVETPEAGLGSWLSNSSPTLLAPGVLSTWGPALRAPHGMISWAGSETATSWPGFAEGSIEAGRRAADEIAGRSRTTGVA